MSTIHAFKCDRCGSLLHYGRFNGKPDYICPRCDEPVGGWRCNHCGNTVKAGEECDCHKTPPPAPNIFTEASLLINGDRRDAYGDYNDEAALIAAGWEALRRGGPITARHVPLMMMWLKMVRESFKPGVDNRRDTAGYLGLLDRMMTTTTK